MIGHGTLAEDGDTDGVRMEDVRLVCLPNDTVSPGQPFQC